MGRGDRLFESWSRLLGEIRQEALSAIHDQPTGIGRMRKAIDALLDGALRRRPIHELAASLPHDARDDVTNKHHRTALALLCLELQRVGAPNPEESASLICDKVRGIARAEFTAAGTLPELRSALYELLEELPP